MAERDGGIVAHQSPWLLVPPMTLTCSLLATIVGRRVLQWGVLLGDGANGPFRFEMQYLRAIRDWSADEYADDDQLLLPENQRRLAAAGGIVPLDPGAAKSDITKAPLAPLHEGDDVRGKMSREDQRELYDELRENAKFNLK